MNNQLPILHLSHQQLKEQADKNAKTSNHLHSIYSLTRNSLSSPMSPAKLNGTGSHILHTKNGEVTRKGLARGYIQASPFYPLTNLHITMDDELIYVRGRNKDGKKVNKAFSKIGDARSYLYKMR